VSEQLDMADSPSLMGMGTGPERFERLSRRVLRVEVETRQRPRIGWLAEQGVSPWEAEWRPRDSLATAVVGGRAERDNLQESRRAVFGRLPQRPTLSRSVA
jgi:hypothetical protein